MLLGPEVVARMRKVEDAYRAISRELTLEEWSRRPGVRVRRQRHATDRRPAVSVETCHFVANHLPRMREGSAPCGETLWRAPSQVAVALS